MQCNIKFQNMRIQQLIHIFRRYFKIQLICCLHHGSCDFCYQVLLNAVENFCCLHVSAGYFSLDLNVMPTSSLLKAVTPTLASNENLVIGCVTIFTLKCLEETLGLLSTLWLD
ncbi:uncharacterized protein LOC111868305 [Cryptotermes secundus]|uniref:uncharacterized protein LOC111868305 n=1 Tax=Cryptotermes secundus TaxID=105785 RepID=UPI000CD7D90B|nr:uncharacterized protein LOC111868305 [Cryptotermes secundus]